MTITEWVRRYAKQALVAQWDNKTFLVFVYWYWVRSRKTCQANREHERSAQATGYTIWGSYPGRNNIFYLLKNVQDSCGVHPASSSIGGGVLPGHKAVGAYVDHSPPSRAEIKEKVELNLFSLVCLHECTRTALPLPFTVHIVVPPTTECST